MKWRTKGKRGVYYRQSKVGRCNCRNWEREGHHHTHPVFLRASLQAGTPLSNPPSPLLLLPPHLPPTLQPSNDTFETQFPPLESHSVSRNEKLIKDFSLNLRNHEIDCLLFCSQTFLVRRCFERSLPLWTKS